MKQPISRTTASVLAVAALVFLSTPAVVAQDQVPAWSNDASIVDDPGDGWISRTWRGVSDAVGSLVTSITPPGPRSWARALRDPGEFQALMHLAGYRIENAETGVGLIPDSTVRFAIARELSDADVDRLERQLARDAKARPGLVAGMQRSVIRTLLDAQYIGRAQVTRVVIDVFPLPRVSYTLGSGTAATTLVSSPAAR